MNFFKIIHILSIYWFFRINWLFFNYMLFFKIIHLHKFDYFLEKTSFICIILIIVPTYGFTFYLLNFFKIIHIHSIYWFFPINWLFFNYMLYFKIIHLHKFDCFLENTSFSCNILIFVPTYGFTFNLLNYFKIIHILSIYWYFRINWLFFN